MGGPDKKLKDDFARDGFIVLPEFFSSEDLAEVEHDTRRHVFEEPHSALVVDDLVTGERATLGFVGAERVRSGRYKVCDLFLVSEALRKIAFARGLDGLLRELMGQPPVLCNSLTFERGSAQPLHIDALYMTPRTHGDLIAIWIALEDTRPDAGPLTYIPGSHLIPPYQFSKGGQHFVQEEMPSWEAYIEAEIAKRGLTPRTFLAKKGDVFVWHAQLVHGGSQIGDERATRRSIVFHYFSQRDCVGRKSRINPLGEGFWMERAHQPVPPPTDAQRALAAFSEQRYLALHPDVAEAVQQGQFTSGLHHFQLFGLREGRAI